MSVPTWKRSVSNTEYIYLLYKLNIKVAEICMKKPAKFRSNYSDVLIKTSLEALKHAQMANSIFMAKTTSEQDFLERRKHLLTARGLVENIATTAYIYFEYVRNNGSESNERINNQERFIGSTCEEAHKKISGVVKSDSAIYKKYIKAI